VKKKTHRLAATKERQELETKKNNKKAFFSTACFVFEHTALSLDRDGKRKKERNCIS
jgi:hypothetical protein